MNVWIKRGACLCLAIAAGCGGGDLPTAPVIPKDFKPVSAPPAGIPPTKSLRNAPAQSGAS